MTKQFLLFFLSLLLTTVLFLMLGKAAVFKNPSVESWGELYQLKAKRSKSIDEKEILLIGGSSMSAGLQAKLIQEQTSIRTTNWGTHAGLGACYHLYRAEKSLQEGDIAIIGLEYASFRTKTGPSSFLVDYVREYDLAYVASIPYLERIPYYFNYSIQNRVEAFFARYNQIKHLSGLNEYHDNINNIKGNQSKAHLQTLLNSQAVDHIFVSKLDLNLPVYQCIKHFISLVKEKNVGVFAVWPPSLMPNNFSFDTVKENHAALEEQYVSLGVVMLEKPEDSWFPRTCFFDSPLHLNYSCAAARTQRIANALSMYIEF